MAEIRADRSENVKYNSSEIRVYVKRGRLSSYPGFSETAHWHNDIELVYAYRGGMNFFVDGNVVELGEGSVIFVNSDRLHYGFSDGEDCDFLCVLIDPFTLCPERLTEKYILPVTDNRSCPYRIFSGESGGRIASLMESMHSAASCGNFVLDAMACAFSIWSVLYRDDELRMSSEGRGNAALSSLRGMLAFICANYGEKVGLNDIARAGNVCRSGAGDIFRKYLHTSPVDFLIHYRLERAHDMLLGTDMRVTDISAECGFPSVSRFISVFGKKFGMTPSEARKKSART